MLHAVVPIRKGALVCALFAAQIAVSGQGADLVGTLIDQVGRQPEEYLRIAPIVIVAKVISNETTGPVKPSAWVPDVSVESHKVICELEEVIRSDDQHIPPGEVGFTYFGTPPGAYNPYHKSVFQAEPGHRYLFALMRQGLELRSVGEVGNYSVSIYSGSHKLPGGTPNPMKSGERIGRILLQPGDGFEPAEFSRSIARYLLIAEALGSHLETYNLLRNLLERPELPVQASTCFELNRFFPGQYECLERIERDERQDEQTRHKAAERLVEARKVEQVLLKNLRDPALLGGSLLKPDSREKNYEQLQILLSHPIALYRSLACVAIRRYYPYSPAARCDQQ